MNLLQMIALLVTGSCFGYEVNENVFYKEGKMLSPDETREVREQMKKNSERLKELIGE